MIRFPVNTEQHGSMGPRSLELGILGQKILAVQQTKLQAGTAGFLPWVVRFGSASSGAGSE